jgi:transmembrane 9 superfamily protein 1
MSFSLENLSSKQLCSLTLNSDEINALRLAIEEFYYFEFVVDDIPIRGFVGQVEETNLFPHKHHIHVYTHHHFDFHINNNQVNKYSKMKIKKEDIFHI